MLHRQLGISADSRICLQIMTEGALGGFIWDLETGNTYLVADGNVIRGHRELPKHVKDIIATTDNELSSDGSQPSAGTKSVRRCLVNCRFVVSTFSNWKEWCEEVL